MKWIQQIGSLFRINSASEFWPYLYLVLFWISIPIIVLFGWLLVRTGRRYETRKEQLRKTINSPDLKVIRFLFKPWLKSYGIYVQENDREA